MKELTLDVQNVIAPPKTKVKVAKQEKNLATENESAIRTSDTESKPVKPASEDEQVTENGVIGTPKAYDVAKGQVLSPARSSHGSPHDGSKDNVFRKPGSSDASTQAKESHRYASML